MEQVNISKDTISISLVLGDLTYDFDRKASLSLAHSIMEWSFFLKNYESRALKMMADHYVFFEQLGMISGIIEEEYVTREAIIGCSLGTKDIKLDAYEDHGVIAANQKPLMTCEDCQVNKNIYSFGTCKRTLFGMGLPHPSAISSESVVDLRVRYQCFPILSKEWMQAEGDLRISDLTGDNFVDALRSGAYLTCLYGGLITVKGPSAEEEAEDNFIKDLRDQGFTEGYIRYLIPLHEKYPKWRFEAVITGVDYAEFVDFQESTKKKCAETDAYSTNKKFEGETSDRYYEANRDAIIFFSNPYSMLMTSDWLYEKRNDNELQFETGYWKYENVFQFLKAQQQLDKDYSDTAVERMLSGKDQTLIDKIKNSNCSINPVFMAAIISIENGPYGEYYNNKQVYNIFNFGADGGRGDARKYAYNHGWFSLDDCIAAVDTEIQPFLDRHQDTLYALDWDYYLYGQTRNNQNGPEVLQYATLVNDAENKAISLYPKDDIQTLLDYEFVFAFLCIQIF